MGDQRKFSLTVNSVSDFYVASKHFSAPYLNVYHLDIAHAYFGFFSSHLLIRNGLRRLLTGGSKGIFNVMLKIVHPVYICLWVMVLCACL